MIALDDGGIFGLERVTQVNTMNVTKQPDTRNI